MCFWPCGSLISQTQGAISPCFQSWIPTAAKLRSVSPGTNLLMSCSALGRVFLREFTFTSHAFCLFPRKLHTWGPGGRVGEGIVITEAQIPLCSLHPLLSSVRNSPAEGRTEVPFSSSSSELGGSNAQILPQAPSRTLNSPLYDYTKMLVKSWHPLWATSRENFFLMLPLGRFPSCFQ